MRAFLLRFFFGADALVAEMAKLLTLRAAAVDRHERNKELAERLASGTEQLAVLKTQYAWTRAAVEAAYNLELD